MRTPARILIADDNPDNLDIFQTRLAAHGYEIVKAVDGEEALANVKDQHPDLILLDIMMPKMDGIEVCRRLKADPSLPFMPVVMVTARSASQDIVTALEAGADEYLTKPVDHSALVARVKSMLRIKALNDKIQEQANQLEAQAAQLAQWNRTLEQRVKEQFAELERVGRLKRFFAPQLAEMIVSGGAEDPLKPHRREVTVVFMDLRGFTAFAETADPEEVMGVLRKFHETMGALIQTYEGTLERFTGDGMMIFFNDPVPAPNAAEQAVRMALSMQEQFAKLMTMWRKRGYDLALGIGIAQGYATLGAIGFEGRLDYGAIGKVTNLAARLCSEAEGSQVLISQRVWAEVEHVVKAEPAGQRQLKGFHSPMPVYNVLGLQEPIQP